jgi:hypothetical protein
MGVLRAVRDRDRPETFCPWGSVYRQFRRWTVSRIWDVIPEALNAAEGSLRSVRIIDSTTAHHCAVGARGVFKVRVLAAQAFGGRFFHRNARRAVSPYTTKIHLRTNGAGLPIALEITGGVVSDHRGCAPLTDAGGLNRAGPAR